MAARLNRMHDETTRAQIKTTQIIKFLMEHVLDGKEIAPTRIKAAEILLRKVLPDLSSVDLTSAQDECRELETAEIHRRIAALEGTAGPKTGEGVAPEVH